MPRLAPVGAPARRTQAGARSRRLLVVHARGSSALVFVLVIGALLCGAVRGADAAGADGWPTVAAGASAGAARGSSRRASVLTVVTLLRPSRRSTSRPAARSTAPPRSRRVHDRGHRPPVVVGGRSTTTRMPEQRVTTANEIHVPVGRPVAARAQLDRRDPQLLGAQPARQARPDPGPRRRPLAPGRPRRHLPRPVRRVLRAPAREHGASWSSPSRRTQFAALAAPASAARRRRRPTDSPQRGQRGLPRAATCVDVPHDQRHAGRRPRRARPDAPRQPRARIAAGTLPNTRGQPGRLDRRSAGHQARRAACRPTR